MVKRSNYGSQRFKLELKCMNLLTSIVFSFFFLIIIILLTTKFQVGITRKTIIRK